ncbi:MAG: DNA/RNA nuclease SfsA [Myxococcota bacterium]
MSFVVPHLGPLQEGRLVARWDRFIAEAKLSDGRVVRAHCVNPGRMEGLVEAGRRLWVRHAPSKTRKLAYTWELVEHTDVNGKPIVIGANTQAPNRIVGALLRAQVIPGLRRYSALRAEVRDGARRLDFLLEGKTRRFVEVKNCHLVYPDGRAYFPDTVSERATAHLHHLIEVVQRGQRAEVLFCVQRPDALRSIRPSAAHDPAFAEGCRQAAQAGVGFRAIQVRPTLEGYAWMGTVPVDLKTYDASAHGTWIAAGRTLGGWKRSKKAKAT